MKRIFSIITLTLCLWIGMAFRVLTITDAGYGFGQSSKTSETSTTMTGFTPNIGAGDYMIIAIAADNITTTNVAGSINDVSSVVDNAGNTFTRVYAMCYGNGAAAGGAYISLWICKMPSAIASGWGTTFTYSGTIAAKAWMAHRFSITAGNRLGVNASTNTFGSTQDGTLAFGGANALTAGGTYLVVRAAAIETATSTVTPTSGWSNFNPTTGAGGAATTGGGAASNMMCYAEFKYSVNSTGTESSTPTLPSGDHADLLVAFYEYTPAPHSKTPDFFKVL